jgi:MarR family transcriptional regulator, lower aerobic nicotinate degradation pathway regulator
MTSTKRNKDIEPGALYGLPGHLIRRCHQISVALFFEECGAFEITPQQYAVLNVLADNDGVDQITLAGLAALNRTTAGEIVDRMVSAGLLERREDPLDRRVRMIFLTKPGLALVADMHDAVLRVQNRLLRPLGPAERDKLIELLARIARENNEFSRAPLRAASRRQRKGAASSVEND